MNFYFKFFFLFLSFSFVKAFVFDFEENVYSDFEDMVPRLSLVNIKYRTVIPGLSGLFEMFAVDFAKINELLEVSINSKQKAAGSGERSGTNGGGSGQSMSRTSTSN